MLTIILLSAVDAILIPASLWVSNGGLATSKKDLRVYRTLAFCLVIVILLLAFTATSRLNQTVSVALMAVLVGCGTLVVGCLSTRLSEVFSKENYMRGLDDRRKIQTEYIEGPLGHNERSTSALLITARGIGGVVELYSDRVRIRRTGITALARRRLGSVTELPIERISSIQRRSPEPPINGYIRFLTTDSSKNDDSTSSAVADENAIFFAASQGDSFDRLLAALKQGV